VIRRPQAVRPRNPSESSAIVPRPRPRHGGTVTLSLLLATLASLAAVSSAGAFVLGVRNDYATVNYPRWVALGDLNGDGNLDVVVVDFEDPHSLSIFYGDGRGRLGPRTDLAVGDQPLSVAIADMNGDGHPDLVVNAYGDHFISVFLNDGQGAFGPRHDYDTGTTPFTVAVGDLNGDRRPDVVTANLLVDSLTVLFGDGSGGLGGRIDLPTGHKPRSAVLADLNGDGHLDVIFTNNGEASIGVSLGDGLGGFGPRSTFPVQAGPFYSAIGDMNGDGRPDVAVANAEQGTLSLLLGDGSGGFASRVDVADAGPGPVSMAMADVNGDGKPDLVWANNGGATSGFASIMVGDGAGGLGPRLAFETGSSSRCVAVGDLNNDGRPDLVVSNAFGDSISVLLADDGGEFGGRTDLVTGGAPAAVAMADFTGDGRPDLVVTDPTLSRISVLAGDGDGGFGGPTDAATGTDPVAVAVGDLNGDGLLDLVVANEVSGTVSVLRRASVGGYSRTDAPAGADPVAVAIGDVNGDGRPDVAVANRAANSANILLANGSGGFDAPLPFATGAGSDAIAISDVTGDGHLDLVVANQDDATVSVLPGNGLGGFGPRVDFSTGSGPAALAIADLNGDGLPDLATANASAGTVSVLFADGLGGFRPKRDFVAGSDPTALAIGDVNGDLHGDLVVTNHSANTASVLLGNGAGEFGPAFPLSTGSGPVALAIGDVSADGRADLAVATRDAGAVSVLLGRVPTRTVLVAGPDPVLFGSPLTLNATVSVAATGHHEAPADSVRFFDGTSLIGTSPVIGGAASLVFAATPLGDGSFSAVYKGDGKLFGSISAARTLRVIPATLPVIRRISDVPGDQGGSVSVDFVASSLDAPDSPTAILGYEIDRATGGSSPASALARTGDGTEPNPAGGPLPRMLYGWSRVTAVPATHAAQYQVVAPTLADSNASATNRATFLVRAITGTAGLFYDSTPDSGCSVDNLAPATPTGFASSYDGSATHLHWHPNRESDLCCYWLYRSNTPQFTPSPDNRIASPTDTLFVDPGPISTYYKLEAVDVNGNPSAYAAASPSGTLGVPTGRPGVLALDPIRPNPWSGRALAVTFSLPTAAPARLELVDVTGRRVRQQMLGTPSAGPQMIELDGENPLAPGIYVVRLSQGGVTRTRWVALLR